MWFDSGSDLARIVLVGTGGYGALIVLLRLSGKRTLAKLNAFDFVVTVALGSTLATIVLDARTSLVDGVVAMGLLVLLQASVASLTLHLPRLRRLVTAGPTVLLLDGVPRGEVMRAGRVSPEELRQAVRGSGSGDLAGIAAVVLETDGTLSVIPRANAGDRTALPR